MQKLSWKLGPQILRQANKIVEPAYHPDADKILSLDTSVIKLQDGILKYENSWVGRQRLMPERSIKCLIQQQVLVVLCSEEELRKCVYF